jgi:thioredoxin 1
METEQRLIVLDFYAEWCGPCNKIAPDVNKLQHKFNNDILVMTVDVDECDDIVAHFNIKSMPTFLFIKNNKLLDIVVGANMSLVNEKIVLYK